VARRRVPARPPGHYLVATRGVTAPDASIPRPVADFAARAAEAAWRALPLKGNPPLTRLAVWLSALECTLDDARARADLGYAPAITRAEGLAALA
jgi:nucleoside-diphosphate-sugar epimerase